MPIVTKPADPLGRERAFWNRRYDSFERRPETYSDHAFKDAITPAFDEGGSPGGLVHRRALDILLEEGIEGKCVLDYCCGRGKWSMHMAALGANVTGFDIANSAVEYARRRAEHNSVSARFDVANAQQLPYPDKTFDVLVGISALEHVIKYEGTGMEARRVLKDGGLAVFTENLGQNFVINLGRLFTMRGEKEAGDVLLTESLVHNWAAGFADFRIEGYSLLFMAKRVVSNRTAPGRYLLRALHATDSALFRAAPRLRRFGGECVIVMRA